MAHFAELDDNNKVIRVLVVNNSVISEHGEEFEQKGIDFLKSIYGESTNWKKTSYNGNIRMRYAGPGSTYDIENDVFIHPKPYESWVLNSNFEWEAPIQKPEGNYYWSEDDMAWLEVPAG